MYHFIQMCILSGFLIIGIILLFSVIVFIIYYLCKYLKYDNDRSTKTFFTTVYYHNFSPDNFDGIKNTSNFMSAIQSSMMNQQETLARTLGEQVMVYECKFCMIKVVEEEGEHCCSHCGVTMKVLIYCRDEENFILLKLT